MPISLTDSKNTNVLSALGVTPENNLSRGRDGMQARDVPAGYVENNQNFSSRNKVSGSNVDAGEVVEKAKKQVLGQEDFLKLLTTQLAHQDPTQPVDNNQMVTQMSQLSMVEGLTTINSSMKDVINAVSSSSALSASSLVGRSVLVDSKVGFFDGQNPMTAKINAGDGYSDIKIVVKDSAGNVVDEYTTKGGKGFMDFAWNGEKGNVDPNAPQKPGDGSTTPPDPSKPDPDAGQTPSTRDGTNPDGSNPDGKPDGSAKPDGTTPNGDKPITEKYPPGMYTIEAFGLDVNTNKQVQLPVAMYSVVGSVTLGKTPSDTILNLIGFGEVPLDKIKEIGL